MSILVVGSIAYDTLETPAGKMDDALGGSTIFFSAAAHFFSPVNVVGVVGTDFNDADLDFLKSANVNFDGLYKEEGKTFRWGGRYHKNMNQRDTLFTHLGVFENFKPQISEHYKNSEYVFLANIHPALQLQVLEQVNKPKLTILDTMNLWISTSKPELEEVISKSDIVIINDEELFQFTGEDNLLKAAHKLAQSGPSSLVIKRGEYGALLYTDDTFFFAPAYPLETVIDPTGAGDTFAGGFVGYLAAQDKIDGTVLRNAVLYGCTAASFTVENFGVLRLRDLTEDKLRERYNSLKKMITF